MIGTKELIERTVKSVKKKDKELIIKEALNNGEEIAIKNFFTIKRQTPKTKGSKRCDKHEREIESFRRANKGKGIQAYAKSEIFKKLVTDTRNCNNCKIKKQQIAKSAKPTTRITLKTSKNF
ncbi:1832_t:CDS:2 [Entrophospora sp. SA101]|nr:1832_t:CDS:2 [Entrophospora sp. SA101]